MPALTIELPARSDQTSFNLARWTELLADTDLGRHLAEIPGRVETDRFGQIIISPTSVFSHGGYQSEIAYYLRQLLPGGRVTTECPVSTADGVKGIDATWISKERLEEIGEGICLTAAPEICVEVLSSDDSRRQMAEKKALLFAAGATEVWFCSRLGQMEFFLAADSESAAGSQFCPDFPSQIQL